MADEKITCTLAKVPPVGIHAVTIKPYKADDIPLFDAFAVKSPEISLDSYQGAAGTPITLTGNFFGTKKGKVYLEDISAGKKKNCKVTSWGMESITFEIPKTSKSFPAKDYLLKVTNKVGEATADINVTLE